MSVLITAVEGGSLSRASRNLRLPLATVSRKVAELEAHLNASLLIRSAKGLELTPAGRSYVTAAKAILEQLTEAERAATGEYTEPREIFCRVVRLASSAGRKASRQLLSVAAVTPSPRDTVSRSSFRNNCRTAAVLRWRDILTPRPTLSFAHQAPHPADDRPLARCLRQP